MPKRSHKGHEGHKWTPRVLTLLLALFFFIKQLGTWGLPGTAGTASLECAQRPRWASLSEHLWSTENQESRPLVLREALALPLERWGGQGRTEMSFSEASDWYKNLPDGGCQKHAEGSTGDTEISVGPCLQASVPCLTEQELLQSAMGSATAWDVCIACQRAGVIQLFCFSPGLLLVHPGRQKVAQVLRSLPPAWQTWMEFWDPGPVCSCLWALTVWTNREIFLFLFFSCSVLPVALTYE